VNQRTKNKIILIFIISVIVIGLSSYFVVLTGVLEVYRTQNNIENEKTNHLDAQLITPLVNDLHVSKIITNFKTNDIFAINNHIDGIVQIYLNDPQNIHQIVGLLLTKNSDMSWLNVSKENTQKSLEVLSNNFQSGTGNLDKNNVYTIDVHFDPTTEGAWTYWVFAEDLNGTWFHYSNIDLPTIEPADSLSQLKNNRIVEGLTWIIIGAIPIGLVVEFWIEYAIENYFYREENPVKGLLPRNPLNM
jgi:hypothetical protein